ncbi:hypothetical protein FPV67DRAFT_1159022 [Lyophyllum atratum]|nr:hypothetical protein FPV67DRAFT_1159022 [Lyophyllum atratum]
MPKHRSLEEAIRRRLNSASIYVRSISLMAGNETLPTMSIIDICPQLRQDGSCQDPSCRWTHNMLTCEACAFMCASAAEMDEHSRSRVHLNKVGGQSLVFKCPLCQTRVHGRKPWTIHLGSLKHLRRCRASGVEPKTVAPEELADVPRHTFCVTCNVHIQDIHWEHHLKNARHLEKERFAVFKVVLDEAEKDKHGVNVAGDFDFGIVEVADATRGKIARGTIKTTNPSSRVTLISIRLASAKGINPGHSSTRKDFDESTEFQYHFPSKLHRTMPGPR